MKVIHTKNAPDPGGHYSQAIVHKGIIYTSGLLPIDPETHERQMGTVEKQTEVVLNNLKAILEASGSDLNHVIRVTVYVSDISHWGKVNEVYARLFGKHKPTRSIIPTQAMHYGFDIELEAIAVLKNRKN